MSDHPKLPARIRSAESPGEGIVFGIPLAGDEYVLGVVIARYPRTIRVGLVPNPVTELPSSGLLSTSDVEIIAQVGSAALDDGQWPVVGFIENFVIAEWPNPPMLPGDRADKAQAPADLERDLMKAVEHRRRLRVMREPNLIPVEHDKGRRYAEFVLGRGPLLTKMVRDNLDFDASSFTATAAFVEVEGEWHTGEVNPEQVPSASGWVRTSNVHERGLIPILHRFLADVGHSAVFHYDWLELPRDAGPWSRIETERYGPLEIFPLQVFFRDEGSRRELYAAVGGEIDQATTESLIERTFDPVLNIVLMLDMDISKLPPHAHPIDARGLGELARRVKALALRFTSYDGYLIWQAA